MKPALRFTDMKIRRAPGFPAGMPEYSALGGGLTVILGPNASGKTTTTLALGKALVAESEDTRWSVSGGFTLGETAYRFDLDAGRLRILQGQSETRFPISVSKDFSEHLFFSLKNLMLARGQRFAEAVRREALGGYDPGAAIEALKFKPVKATKSLKEFKELQRVESEIGTLREEERRLLQRKSRLSELEDHRAQARQTAQCIEPLRRLLEYLDAKDRHAVVLSRLDRFSPNVAKCDGREMDELRRLEEALRSEESTHEIARREQSQAEEALARVNLGDLREDPSPDIMRRLDALQKAEEEFLRHKESAASTAARRRELLERAGLDAQSDVAQFPPGYFTELQAVLHELEKAEATYRAADAERRRLADLPQIPKDAPDAALSAEGVRRLAHWLAEADEFSIAESELKRLVLIAVAVATLGAAGAFFVHAGLAFVAAAAAALPLIALLKKPSTLPRDQRKDEFSQLGLAAPGEWTPREVARRMDELLREAAVGAVINEKRLRLGDVERTCADLKEALSEIEGRRQKAAEYLGFSTTDSAGLLLFAGTAVELTACLAREAQINEALRLAGEQRDAALAAFNALMGRYDDAQAETAAEAADTAHAFAKRAAEHMQALQKSEYAEARLQEASDRLQVLRRDHDAIFAKLDLPVGDKKSLGRLLEERLEYGTLQEEMIAARNDEERLERSLAGCAFIDAELRHLGRDALAAQLRDAEQAADAERSLAEEIGGLRRELELARQNRSLEDLLAERNDLMRKLKDVREAHCLAEVGALLGQYLEQNDRETIAVGVFHRAEELFSEISNGRYRLIFNREGPSFSAEDRDTGRMLSLNELSDGTRLQLLLTLRTAFIEEGEKEARLPLFLDETLANSDPERSEAVVKAVLHLCRRGRQVFYLTARPEEAAVWQRALERAGHDEEALDADVRFIDLGSLWKEEQTAALPLETYAALPVEEVPAPDGRDHAAYGELLGVPGISLDTDPDAAHIWHFIEEVDTVQRLLQLRHGTLGRMKALYQRDASGFPAGANGLVTRARSLEQVLRSVLPLARRGRGKPVDRAVLVESGIVSPRFLEETAHLADALDNDAARLIRALRNKEVKNFRQDAVERLADHFKENGYLDERPAPSKEELLQRAMLEASKDITAGVLTPGDVHTLLQRLAP